jgi:hypothetical protein
VSAEPNPLFRVVKGEPTAEELAALTAVVLAAASGGGERERPPASPWAARSGQTRGPLDHGPGAWRASGLPR